MFGIGEVWKYVGGLSKPSKMPCHGWSISAFKCLVGSKLAKTAGSVCSKCYARKGRYVFSNVQAAHERRLEAFNTRPDWDRAMARLIEHYEGRPGKSGFFRWFDSGDLQSTAMLAKIVSVAEMTPTVRHWLPTKEYGIVHSYAKSRDGRVTWIPHNLTIRVSAPMVDQVITNSGYMNRPGIVTSSVSSDSGTCPAYNENSGVCGDCRACWDPTVRNVVYPAH